MKIGKYEVVRQIGKGGMSEVFEVEDPSIGSRHALKIYTYAKDDPEVRNRFLVEGRLLAKLSHPGIVKVTDIGDDGDRPFFVMDLILGPGGEKLSLADIPEGSADEETIGRWYDDIRSALAYIHSKGVVHRDLKLQNVMIGPDSRAVLADFGISRIFRGDNGEEPVDAVNTIVNVRDGRKPVMGSLGYMAPELEMGAAATPKSDWYALGVMTYKLLTGTWCDSRTDIVSTLETYSPAWQAVIPPLLHSNPDGRECLSYSETKESLREKAEAETEKTLLEAERRRRKAGIFAAAAAAVAVFASIAAAATFARLARVNAKYADAKAHLALPTFAKAFAIPSSLPGGDAEGIVEKRHDLELAQVDAWVLTHKYFDGMAEGVLSPDDALEALKAVQRKVVKNEEDDLLGDEYDTVGENEPLKELFKLAVRKTAKSIRRHNRIAGRPVSPADDREDAVEGER